MRGLYAVLRGAALAMLVIVAAFASARGQNNVAILTIPDTTVAPTDSLYALSFYLANPQSAIAAFELNITASRPNLMELLYAPSVDTFISCNGGVCDTTISTINRVNMQVAGTPLQSWDYVQARAWTPLAMKVVAVSDLPVKPGTPAPVAVSDTPVFLFSVMLRRTAEPWYLDTASERTVNWFGQQIGTSYVDPFGQNVPMPDTVLCWDPPACTNTDTVPVMPSGAVTFGPGCIGRGDVNRDGVISASDIIGLVAYVFKGGAPPGCDVSMGDANCDGVVTSADVIYLVLHVFKGGAAPCVS